MISWRGASKRNRLHYSLEHQSRAESSSELRTKEQELKIVNALVDWCRDELRPFLDELDKMEHPDEEARATFLHQNVISPLFELQKCSNT